MAAPQPYNERFAESKYSGGIPIEAAPTYVTNVTRYPERRTTHRSRNIARGARRGARVAMRTTGTTMQAGGLALQATGKTAKVTGDATTRTGVALSSTGVGAIVGAPLAVGGRVMRMAGGATNTAGKVIKHNGKRIKLGTQADAMLIAQSTVIAARSISWTSALWIKAQIPFAIFTVLFFGLSYGLRVIGNQLFKYFGGENMAATADVIMRWTGSATALGALVGASDGLFFISLATTAVIGLIQIFGVMATYGMKFFSVLGGRGGALKFLVVTVCILGYVIPFLNFFPWVWLYLMVMVRYPK